MSLKTRLQKLESSPTKSPADGPVLVLPDNQTSPAGWVGRVWAEFKRTGRVLGRVLVVPEGETFGG